MDYCIKSKNYKFRAETCGTKMLVVAVLVACRSDSKKMTHTVKPV
jgi:hypothetical protein